MPVTNYIYNPLTEAYLMEQDGDGNTTVVYTQEPVKYGDVIAQHRIDPATGVGESFYYHTDALGSTRELTDASGNVVNTYNYDAFGNTIASTGTVENPFRFTGNVGYYFDKELQTYHIRARNYQPTTGRWTSQDPIGFAGGDSNLFAYVGNSPTGRLDPTGNEPITIMTGVVVVSTVRGVAGLGLGAWLGYKCMKCYKNGEELVRRRLENLVRHDPDNVELRLQEWVRKAKPFDCSDVCNCAAKEAVTGGKWLLFSFGIGHGIRYIKIRI